jgi:hypothetical protein
MTCPGCKRIQSPKALFQTNPLRGWNKADFHMCGTCGHHLYLTGKGRNKRFFLVQMPLFLTLLIGLSFLFAALGWNVTEGPNAGEPTLPAGLLMCAVLFTCLAVCNARLEEIALQKVERANP